MHEMKIYISIDMHSTRRKKCLIYLRKAFLGVLTTDSGLLSVFSPLLSCAASVIPL